MRLAFCVLFLSTLSPLTAGAQDGASIPEPSVEDLKSSLEEIQSDASLEELVRDTLVARYEEAIEFAESEASYRERKQGYNEVLEAGASRAGEIRQKIEEWSEREPEPVADPKASDDEILSLLAQTQADLARLQSEKENLNTEIAELRGRPDAIRERLSEARDELGKAREEWRSTPSGPDASPADQATRARAAARIAALKAEIEMLEQEDRSAEIRRQLADANRELTELRIEEARNRVEQLRRLASLRVETEAQRASLLLSSIREQLDVISETDPSPEQTEFFAETEKLIRETRSVSGSLRSTESSLEQREQLRNRIVSGYEDIRTRFEAEASTQGLSPLLLEQLRSLPPEWSTRQRIRALKDRIAEARAGLFERERIARERVDSGSKAPAPPEGIEDRWKELLKTRAKLHQDLVDSYQRWLRALGMLNVVEQEILETSRSHRSFAREKLFWVRSSPVVFSGAFSDLDEALLYCFGPNRVRELFRYLGHIPVSLYIGLALFVTLLLGGRLLVYRKLRAVTLRARQPGEERFSLTVGALFLTLLIALPFPVFLAGTGFSLALFGGGSQWITGLGTACLTAAPGLYFLLFIIAICRHDGLGEIHFRWDSRLLSRARRFAAWVVPVYLVPAIVLHLIASDPNTSYLGTLGRLALLFAVIVGGALLAKLMHPKKGLAAAVHRRSPTSSFGRGRYIWFRALVVGIAFLAALLFAGYVYTGLLLLEQIQKSLAAVLAAFVIHGLVLRWFFIREQRAAREEALAERRAEMEQRLEERRREGLEESETLDEFSAIKVEEEETIDLAEVKDQTRRFVGFFVGILLLWWLHGIWANFEPFIEVFDDISIVGLSLVEIGFIVIVVAVVAATIQNLSGILDILVLRRTTLDPGTQNAVVTLAKYTTVAIGAVILFRNLGVDWSQFGWIAAALSVGLGFGLQEVVANFISGIILLFERPIRVGDIVTIDGIDGRVTKIQIRATTITNWDRKEFIVPNKQFITGTLMNWTRGDSINRITVLVGVAYGTDTEEARSILLDVANDHPGLMEDPAPIATFEEFGSSSLGLILRCYVPNLDNRLGVISELHTEIDRRFREAGIEIAFPQMDVHLDAPRNEVPNPDFS